MIKSGRNTQSIKQEKYTPNTRAARLTAIFGVLVFTVFLCSSAGRADDAKETSGTFGEGAYQVFASTEGTADTPENTFAEKDGSIWAYLESVIFNLLYGKQ